MYGSLILLLLPVSIWLLQDHFQAIRRNGKRLRRPPGTLPLAGYGLWFLQPRHVLLAWFAHIQDRMGFETFELPVPSLPPAVLINDPSILEQILRDTTTFIKGDFFRTRSEDLFRDGILNADGELWKLQRKAGLRFLTASNIEWFIDVVLPPLLDDTMGELSVAATSDEVVDLQVCLLNLTTRFMGLIAYDMDLADQMSFSKAFEFASAETGYRFTNPLWKLKRRLFGGSFAKAIGEIHAFGASIVDAAKREQDQVRNTRPERSPSDQPVRVNLIQSLLKHLHSSETVAAAAMNYLSAGRDTTAQSMAWTIYHLMQNPRALGRLRMSLGEHDPLKTSFGCREIRDSHKFHYFLAVFAESLRLSPPIPLEIKETTKTVVLEDGTLLPSGAVVVWSPFAMARNCKIWGTDAGHFRPERWLHGLTNTVSYKFEDGEERERLSKIDFSGTTFVSNLKSPFENPVFNGGPRACIGKQLAELLAAATVCKLLCSFDIEAQWPASGNGNEKVGQDGLTMPIQDGLPVRLRKREAATQAS